MIYDPEINLLIEQEKEKVAGSVERLRRVLPPDHPAIAVFEAFVDLFDIINQLRNDRDNCFDEDERNKLEREMRKSLKNITNEWAKVAKLYGLS